MTFSLNILNILNINSHIFKIYFGIADTVLSKFLLNTLSKSCQITARLKKLSMYSTKINDILWKQLLLH